MILLALKSDIGTILIALAGYPGMACGAILVRPPPAVDHRDVRAKYECGFDRIFCRLADFAIARAAGFDGTGQNCRCVRLSNRTAVDAPAPERCGVIPAAAGAAWVEDIQHFQAAVSFPLHRQHPIRDLTGRLLPILAAASGVPPLQESGSGQIYRIPALAAAHAASGIRSIDFFDYKIAKAIANVDFLRRHIYQLHFGKTAQQQTAKASKSCTYAGGL